MTTDHYTLGWLPTVLPVDARRFGVADDPTLAAVLAEAGGEVVDAGADVEIAGSADAVEAGARVAIVSIGSPSAPTGSLVARAAAKGGAAVAAQRAIAKARRRLHNLGYPDVSVLRWDIRHRVALAGAAPSRRTASELVPGRALVVGRRGTRAPTALEAALEDAGRAVGTALGPSWVSIRPGPVLAATDTGVLRVAIGASRVEIDGQVAALTALAAADVAPAVADKIPWLLADGEVGLARWSLERVRPGARPSELGPKLLQECVEFLVAFHGADGAGVSLSSRAEEIAAVCADDSASRVRALAVRLEKDLAHVRRGFGHGDFFAGNLLVTGERLTGVLDWDAGGPGRLPLLDLLHLLLTRTPYGSDERWGRAVLDRLLPLARGGGDDAVLRYCEGVGIEPEPKVLEALVLAYWFEYAAYQLRTHPDRRTDRGWIEGNLELVLREAGAGEATSTGRGVAGGALTREA